MANHFDRIDPQVNSSRRAAPTRVLPAGIDHPMGAGGRVDDVGIEQLAVGPATRERDSVTSLGFYFGQKILLLLLERKGVQF
ncbi:hypothetical protein B296_00028557 [Ensete ventricosum]|uniref:Uncharacterized protein n=1 Tax=Ensete ventricosum TaxID=4639 RepID=A0A426Z7K1_ENSVE|nr:hypothetical protein B296_00028557 [Ensete ventricosum]